MTATQVVDLAIIGSGSGNAIPDDRFADKTLAIFEEGVYGGTCLNVGCIPTKMFVYASEVAEIARHGARLGVHSKVDSVDWPGIVERVFGRIDPLSQGGKEYRVDRCENITVYDSHVEFDGRDDDGRYRLVTRDGDTVLADEVVLAAGSRAVIPQIIADSGVTYYTNNDVMRLPELPERLIIVGSGYIAAEFAHVFGALGSHVSIIARGPGLLRKQDADISNRFTQVAREKWDVRLETTITEAEDLPDGGVRVGLSDGATLEADVLLIATGRQPNGDRLNLDSVGIELDDEGRVRCDQHGRTAARGVWTLGDVSSPYQLKHVANHEQRVVQANLLKGWDATDLDAFDHRYVPAAVFTHPQIAAVGLTEDEAREAGHDIAVKVQAYGDVAYGWAMEDTTGFCKLIAERGTGRLLGAHLIGPQAPTVIQPVIQAMHFGQTAHELARGQYWIHPAMPEVLENAILGLDI
ncbi:MULTISPECIES: mycothione reductase [unclassified Gordonia (in: high G+C Gram-positive bacteria)]|uniref:mycothione reductase n=1 Tax=unclassified Gordonia (in: high G+C Gram-positive bacteria) TaxID=2657482 RepID=UPI00083A0F1B|nr:MULTISPECIES: mycothione reductase [unclassified Gordonia (in: high G+C Gram-positive bacteria)]MBN0971753.1 mycothione reductase [Gordonia sp. BP-119]MBN0981721.1 mycothione reductase [Gordonia sp. BP-94]OCW86079.1 mycothione reductase [Nocardia farcinica]WGJ87429.1 mycothione reductase [Gordonia sp. SMJS1]